MEVKENVPLKPKTTMRIGGNARYYAELKEKTDVEEAFDFAKKQSVPLIVLGGGSNTIFADGTINALVVRLACDKVSIEGEQVIVEAAKNLPMLVNELAEHGLDLAALTGILGTVGGAIYGNAGQGPKGLWTDRFVESVEVFVDGVWKTFSKTDCHFDYRESAFKHMKSTPVIWSTTLRMEKRDPQIIKAMITELLRVRIETQPHIKTAGSCFKAVGSTPAWQLIDAAGLRSLKVGGVNISEKHTNFLINDGNGSFDDAVKLVQKVKDEVKKPLEVEMRFIKTDGTLCF